MKACWVADDINDAIWVPHVRSSAICPKQHRRGYGCTRPKGHTGRHAAGGMRRPNGLRPIFAVWGKRA